MKISKIKVQNFRSIKEAIITPNQFNIFVGQNNHGKTNLFEAMEWFYNGLKKGETIEPIRFGQTGDEEVFVEIEFIEALDGASKMKNEANKTKMVKLLDGNDKILVKRSSNDPKKRLFNITGEWTDKLPTGFDKAFNDFLPKFEYVDTKKYFEDVGKYAKTTPVGIMLSGVLTALLEKSESYRKFHQQFDELFTSDTSEVKIELDKLSSKVKICLEKQFPDCTKVTFEVSPPVFDDLLKNFDTTVDDGIETSASEKGDGMQRALMLAILQAYAEFRKSNEEIDKTFLFFIDEAELHLHPTAQRKLKNVLKALSNDGDQIFINTHSSVLVVDDEPNQAIFKVEKIERMTEITLADKSDKQHIIYELLGGSPADLLLPRNFLIVEGKSEFEFLIRVIKRFYSDKPQIQIVQADGDVEQAERSLNAIEQLYKPLETSIYKETTIIMLDKQKNAEALKSFLGKRGHLKTNNQLHELSAHSLEEYYPDKNGWRKDAASVAKMTSEQKWKHARKVGEAITQEDFEREMSIVFGALNACWQKLL